jgi:hypothetical protein
MLSTRSVIAPHQRRRQLERIGRSELVDIEKTFSGIAHFIGGLDLVPTTAQIGKAAHCLLLSFHREAFFAAKPVERADSFDGSRPPRHFNRVCASLRIAVYTDVTSAFELDLLLEARSIRPSKDWIEQFAFY